MFETLRKHNMKLNLKQCTFGVQAGKFIGYMINQRGSETNPNKVKVVQMMNPPRTITDQKLTGCIVALRRFMSRSVDKCLPLLDLLRKKSKFVQIAFEGIKSYLAFLSRMVSHTEGEVIFLYLAVSPNTMSTVLIVEREITQNPIDFTSHALNGPKLRYPLIEKFGYALLISSWKLKPILKPICLRFSPTNH